MRTTAKLTSAVVATAIIFGLSTSVANAAEPTSADVTVAATTPALQQSIAAGDASSPTTPSGDMNLQSSLGFDVVNQTGHTFVVGTVFATDNGLVGKFQPDDSYPAKGTVLGPNQKLDFQVQAWNWDHGIVVVLYDTQSSDSVTLYMTVGLHDRYMDSKTTIGKVVPQPSIGEFRIVDS